MLELKLGAGLTPAVEISKNGVQPRHSRPDTRHPGQPARHGRNGPGGGVDQCGAQGFGEWTLVGTSLTIFAPDDVTPVSVFTLDSATDPTMRV